MAWRNQILMDDDHPWRWAFTALFTITLTHAVLGLLVFLWRRHHHPLTGHSFPLVALSTCSLGYDGLHVCAAYMNLTVTCHMWRLTNFLAYNGPAVAYIIRAWRIYVFYKLAGDKLRQNSLSSLSVFEKSVAMEPHRSSIARDVHTPNDHEEVISVEMESVSVVPSAVTNSADARISDHATSMARQTPSPSHRKAWSVWGRQQTLFSDRNIVVFALAILVLSYLAEFVPIFVRGDVSGVYTVGVFDGGCNLIDPNVRLVIVGITIAIAITSIWKLRRVFDGYKIKLELGIVCFWALLVGVALLEVFETDVKNLMYVVLENGMIATTVSWKVALSFRGNSDGREAASSESVASPGPGVGEEEVRISVAQVAKSPQDLTLKMVLADKRAMAMLAEFMRREWAVENLLFYRAAYSYRVKCTRGVFSSPVERASAALKIYRQYISRYAPSEVNISARARTLVTERIAKCLPGMDPRQLCAFAAVMEEPACVDEPMPTDLFAEAAQETFKLIEQDSMRRFWRSRLCASLFVEDPKN